VPSPQLIQGVDQRGKPLQGLKNGKVTELAMWLTVKPGHEEAIRQAIYDFCNDPLRDSTSPAGERGAAAIGIHEMRMVLFDNDKRLAWWTSFDTDWDTYIDDTIVLVGLPTYAAVLKHTVEAPGNIDDPNYPNAANAVKDIFNSVRITAAGLLVTFADVTIADQIRNRDVRKAFDACLNEPGAAEALQHPALKRCWTWRPIKASPKLRKIAIIRAEADMVFSSYRRAYADLKDVRLHYVEAGQGMPVLLVHGIPETSYAWRHVMPLLSDKSDWSRRTCAGSAIPAARIMATTRRRSPTTSGSSCTTISASSASPWLATTSARRWHPASRSTIRTR
jgi:hypothetical protein